MKKIYRNSLFMLAAGALVASCADYNVTDNFTAEPDPTIVEPYKDLAAVKSYINKSAYPNMTLGATLDAKEFNKQELAHSAAITNFENFSFGSSLMSGNIVNEKGVMNFLDLKDLLDHMQEINGEVYGSPIVANENQADAWLGRLASPIEIPVDYVEGKKVNYNDSTKFNSSLVGNGSIQTYDKQKLLRLGKSSFNATDSVNVIDGFAVDPLAKYTCTLWVIAPKGAIFTAYFSGNYIEGTGTGGKYEVEANKWTKIVLQDIKSAEGITDGYLTISNTRKGQLYVKSVDIGYYPDNHRPQTEQELSDTINYALNAWCDGLMKINAGRIKTFDLIDEPIDSKKTLDNGMYDLKHSKTKYYWQDVLGSENYAPEVSKVSTAAFTKHGGNAADLKFFIGESGLEDPKKVESLKYWIGIWDAKGAKIDGINAKVTLVYNEDETKQSATQAAYDAMLKNLVAIGKAVRLSNFDIKYKDADGASVAPDKITTEQRQKLADFYAYCIKSYMNTVPSNQQAGICKGSLVDTSSDPVGLWSKTKSGDWSRTATYKAFCDALSGK